MREAGLNSERRSLELAGLPPAGDDTASLPGLEEERRRLAERGAAGGSAATAAAAAPLDAGEESEFDEAVLEAAGMARLELRRARGEWERRHRESMSARRLAAANAEMAGAAAGKRLAAMEELAAAIGSKDLTGACEGVGEG